MSLKRRDSKEMKSGYNDKTWGELLYKVHEMGIRMLSSDSVVLCLSHSSLHVFPPSSLGKEQLIQKLLIFIRKKMKVKVQEFHLFSNEVSLFTQFWQPKPYMFSQALIIKGTESEPFV